MKRNIFISQLICICIIIAFTLVSCNGASEQPKDEVIETKIETVDTKVETVEDSLENTEEVTKEAEEESLTESEYTIWDEWLEDFKLIVKGVIEDYFDGELTKVTFEENSDGPVVAYNTKWSSNDTVLKELFDITKVMATGDLVLFDLDLTATNDYGDSIRVYTLSKYMKKIENLELSYDEWVTLVIDEEKFVDENSNTNEEVNEIIEQEESKTEDVFSVQNNDEETVFNQIMEQAQKDWPDDRDMQEFQYNNQVEAYHDILNLSNTTDYHDGILIDAQKDWPGDFQMQLFQYENQLEAYHDILNLPNTNDYNEAALNRAKSDWPGDYQMQIWQYNNEK